MVFDTWRSQWRKEFDRLWRSGAPRLHMNFGRYQVRDAAGNYWRRNGKACCGCGKNRQLDGLPEGMPPDNIRPAVRAEYRTTRKGKHHHS